jgi:hypothetical protein
VIAALVTSTVSLPVAVATVVFLIALRLVEDYVPVPHHRPRGARARARHPGGGAARGVLLGILGAFPAIPVAAAVSLIMRETVLPSLDER